MKTSDFDYLLPQELIAQTPIEPRAESRLLSLDRNDGTIKHNKFFEITDFLREGDVLVFNNSLVIPARLKGKRTGSGGKLEVLLLRREDSNVWETLVKPAKSVKAGTSIEITGESGMKVSGEAIGMGEDGARLIKFSDEKLLFELGEIALPPYIHVPLENPERYQTVYAESAGSVAAPTAGLHFTPELLGQIRDKGVETLFTTLHVGLDTFRPVREEDPLEHTIHSEYGTLSPEVAAEITRAKKERRRVICVGTTSVRLVEAAAQESGKGEIEPFEGWIDLFILPGHKFRIVDAMITNFHLPRSTLLMLVSAFAGRGLIKQAYEEAIAEKYRFYSFGDAMFIL
ncbi:tRNA preQ1(34) S-adenosylmethionine ribosyltransferase-isomerase QueA [Chloroflexota bacterium]